MAINMNENGKIMILMDMGYFIFQMEINKKENGKIIKKKDME